MKWPRTADGDVFRSLKDGDFDFSKSYEIDFNIDFKDWPPQNQAIELLTSKYPNIEVIEPDEIGSGYLSFSINNIVTYEYIITMQEQLTKIMHPYGGLCDSWGIFHD